MTKLLSSSSSLYNVATSSTSSPFLYPSLHDKVIVGYLLQAAAIRSISLFFKTFFRYYSSISEKSLMDLT